MGMSEIIKKMKVFLQNEISVQMTDVKTKDGIILSFEGELVSGIEIFQVDETGKNPAPTAEYILEDGQIIMVEDGKITEVKAPEEPIEAPDEESEIIPVAEMVEEKPEEVKPDEPKEEKPEVENRIKKLEDEIVQIKTILSELATEMSKTELKSEIKQDLKLSKVSEVKNNLKFNTNSNLSNILNNMYKK